MRPNRKQATKPALSPAQKQERLDAIGITRAESRTEAINARKESGIEEVWLACEEAYLGIDETNKNEFANARWAKPTSMEGPLQVDRAGSGDNKSTAFVRLTSRYVDVGAAKLAEILLPIDDKPFAFEPTPIPDLIKGADDMTPYVDGAGQPIMRNARPEEVEQMDPAAAQPGSEPPQVPITVKDVTEIKLNKAKDAAKKAEKRIYDWMVQCNFPAEMRKVIHDSARIGVGVIKAPFPDLQKLQAVTKVGDEFKLQYKNKVVPAARWIDPWNLFPDGACGENIHHGDGIWERDFLAPRKLKELIGQSGYIKSQIMKVLKEGPDKCNVEGANPNEKINKKRFQIWFYTGTVSREELTVLDTIGVNELPGDVEEVFAIITMVNDTVIRATINPLESGKFSYHAFPWSRRAGHWAGVGPGEQVSMPQRMCNAATRAMLNNAGNSAGIQLIIDRMAIVPADGRWSLTPNKIWWKSDEAAGGDVRNSMASIEFPDRQDPLMRLIDYAFRLAEEATNIPVITQGQVGPTTPDTFGATELQNNNAHTLLRCLGYSYDDHITSPVVHGFYEWLLLDENVPNEEKGDFQINAHGSAAMIEKAIQEQTLMQMGQMALNPAFGIDPKKWFNQYLTAKRLDPRDVQYTEEDLAKMAQQPPQQPVQVQVAQVRAASAKELQAAKDAAALQRLQQEAAIAQQIQSAGNGAGPATAAVAARIQQEQIRARTTQMVETNRLNIERERSQIELAKIQAEREMQMFRYANDKNMTLDQVKAELAKSAMQEQTKRELAAAEIDLARTENDKDRAAKAQTPNVNLQRDMMTTRETP